MTAAPPARVAPAPPSGCCSGRQKLRGPLSGAARAACRRSPPPPPSHLGLVQVPLNLGQLVSSCGVLRQEEEGGLQGGVSCG